MSQSIQSEATKSARRPTRSKNGCLTCRRRKVRCSEQRPRCSHCERLCLDCRWPSRSAVLAHPKHVNSTFIHFSPNASHQKNALPNPAQDVQRGNPISEPVESWIQRSTQIEELFDYASFLWDEGDTAGQSNRPPLIAYPPAQRSTGIDSMALTEEDFSENTSPVTNTSSQSFVPREADIIDDKYLIDYFVQTVVPSIIADVETQKRWCSMRQTFMSMSRSSSMVRHSILAFSLLLWCRSNRHNAICHIEHYETASVEVMCMGYSYENETHSVAREYSLATLFFLIYIDVLGERVQSARAHLEKAYEIFSRGEKNEFRPVELRLLSWIRLLDARAVSAGGEGLFLCESDEKLLVQQSPSSIDDTESTQNQVETSSSEIEEVLFQTLYHPGIIFYQKVQSFMGRISKIDPWHRSRGTVEDETEVMNIAANILKDLRKLYESRPALMDLAVVGHLTSPHVSPSLAHTLTVVLRTYLSNYHASKFHLHRVAYKSFAPTKDTVEALGHIRQLARLIAKSLEPDEVFPASMLWPLLMWGSEEKDLLEREWILEKIRTMEKIATNAMVTAQVLEEVQRRQDSSNSRVDIRSVMHSIFDSSFAII